MLSYDYNHFEVCLSSDDEMTLEQIDNLRKEAQRLADKAVEQYKIARREANGRLECIRKREELRKEVDYIKKNYPQSEWTPEHKAKVKCLEQYDFMISHRYDYEDDWNEDEF